MTRKTSIMVAMVPDFKSYNGGQTSISIHPPGETNQKFLCPFEKHPTDPQIIYGAVTDVWISYNQGDEWNNLTNGLSQGYFYSTLKIAPQILIICMPLMGTPFGLQKTMGVNGKI